MVASYTTYKDGLKMLKIVTLDNRRKNLCLAFAKKCLRNDKVRDMFPKKKSNDMLNLRKRKKYEVLKANTNRYKKSAVPYMLSVLFLRCPYHYSKLGGRLVSTQVFSLV